MQADGFSLDDKRQPVAENDIPDIINRYHNLENDNDRKRTEKSFFVSKEEIIKNDYDLSINRYKEIEYDEVEYEAPKVIIQRIKELEQQILDGLNDIERMV
jgi:type I restriction enzyme M protein